MSALGRKRTSQTNYTRTAVTGQNLTTAMSAIMAKITNTTPCVIANGGSDCVGASAFVFSASVERNRHMHFNAQWPY
jgi:hypothetical protein